MTAPIFTDRYVPTDPRLGRHIRHDPRSKAYAFQAPGTTPLVDVSHTRYIAILDQGTLGSCHDADTEILTRHGWLPFPDLTETNELATVDPKTGDLTYERPVRVVRLPYAGDIHVVSTQGQDFRVTPDHSMLVRKWDEGARSLSTDYSFVAMKDIGWYAGLMTQVKQVGTQHDGTYAIPGVLDAKHAGSRADLVVPMRPWLGFLGIYLAEGTMLKPYPKDPYKFQIAATKEREKAFVKGVLTELGVHFCELADRFTFSHCRIYRHLESLGLKGVHAPEKFVPDFVFNLPAEDISAMLVGHREGDGSLQNGTWTHHTSSPGLADDLQRLIFLSGGKTGRSVRDPHPAVMRNGRTINGKHPGYAVRHLAGGLSSIERKASVRVEHYEGMVYCAEVPTHHTLVTRRNGKILISGNCTGNAAVGALGSGVLWTSLASKMPVELDETMARGLYSEATQLDNDPGQWPPTDTGSDGLSVAKAAKLRGFISGYRHAFSLAAFLAALQQQPVIVGTDWYRSMFTPDASGLVTVDESSGLAGGHEYVARRYRAAEQVIGFDNSWGAGWGNNGTFWMSVADFGKLLAANGDATIFTPLTLAPPTPAPEPPSFPDALVAAAHALAGDPDVARFLAGQHFVYLTTVAARVRAVVEAIPGAGLEWAHKHPLCHPGQRELLDRIDIRLRRMENTMATQQDIDNLAARVDAVGTAVTTGVAGVRQDIADLKAANPGVDTTALEASVSALEQGVGGLTELDSENPGAPVTPVTPSPEPAPVDPQA